MTVHPYWDEFGRRAFFRERVTGADGRKAFYPWHPAPVTESEKVLVVDDDGWCVSVAMGLPAEHRDLVYRLPSVLQAVRDHDGSGLLYLPEGEKDAESLVGLGHVASTGHGGAGQWSAGQAAWFAGYRGTVCILVDNDAPGAYEGLRKLDTLTDLSLRVRVLAPPEPHKDVSDLLAAGGSLDDLVALDRAELGRRAGDMSETSARAWHGYSAVPTRNVDQLMASGSQWSESATEFDPYLASQVHRERLNRQVRRIVNAEEAAASWEAPPSLLHMGDELALPDEQVEWLIENLHARGTNTLVVASHKVGKTVLALNLVRSLVDSQSFLGSETALPDDGSRVAWSNYELTTNLARRWVRELGIENLDRISHLSLRGYPMPLMAPLVRDFMVDWLRDRNVKVWVIDPFAEAYDGDENDNSQVREWLKGINEIKALLVSRMSSS